MLENKAVQKIRRGEPVLCAFVSLNDPTSAELMAKCGIDVLMIENEHMAFTDEQIRNVAHAVTAQGSACIMRTTCKDEETLMHYLELGLNGFCATQTCSVEDAQKVINAVKYPPAGKRGLCTYSKSFDYGLSGRSISETMDILDDNTIIFAVLEDREGIENAEKIAALKGIDSVHIGPGDLSVNLGLKGDSANPKVQNLIEETKKRIRAAGGRTGEMAGTPEGVKKCLDEGAKFIVVGADIGGIIGKFAPLGKVVKNL